MEEYDVVNMSLDDFKDLIASGDDTHDNQIRVTRTGKVFLLQDIVGAECLENIAFRFETFYAGNGYVGKVASEDKELVTGIYKAIKSNWDKGSLRTYIDDWRIREYR